MKSYAYKSGGSAGDDIRAKYGFDGELLEIFETNKGRAVHKWHHYIPLYDRYFAPFRHRPVRFLEIGVSFGGSLQMWRKFFGDDAVLFGIDIEPKCAVLNGEAAQVRIGSQDDPAFLDSVLREMGGIDVVLDDGSHTMEHIRATLRHLFPRLNEGGVYFIEDLHTAYWRKFGGGYRHPGNFFNMVHELMNDMHVWYHDQGLCQPGIGDAVSGIHVHDSIVVLDKNPVYPPAHSMIL